MEMGTDGDMLQVPKSFRVGHGGLDSVVLYEGSLRILPEGPHEAHYAVTFKRICSCIPLQVHVH